jgi:hypothetical protein
VAIISELAHEEEGIISIATVIKHISSISRLKMRKYFTVLVLLLCIFNCTKLIAQGSLAALDAKNGFRDVKFGMPLKAYPGMVLIPFDPDDNYQRYLRKSDKLQMGDIPLKEVTYLFYKSRLINVQVWVYGIENREKVLQALSYAYGQPSMKYKPKRDWFGKKVEMYYIENKDYDGKNYCYFDMTSKIMRDEIEHEIQVYEDAKLKKAATAVRKAASDL